MTPSDLSAPLLRRLAAVVLAVQVIAILVGVLLVVSGLFAEGADTEVAIVVSVVGLLLALALALACRALWVGKTWPRGLVMTWQVLLAVITVSNLLNAWSVLAFITVVMALVGVAAIIMDMRQDQSSGGPVETGEAHR